MLADGWVVVVSPNQLKVIDAAVLVKNIGAVPSREVVATPVPPLPPVGHVEIQLSPVKQKKVADAAVVDA